MTETIGVGIALGAGLVALRSGRNPLRLAMAALLHAQTALRVARIAARKAVETARARYREEFETVCREAGR